MGPLFHSFEPNFRGARYGTSNSVLIFKLSS